MKRIVTTGDIGLLFNGLDHIYSKNNNSSTVNKPVVIEEKEIPNKENLSCDHEKNNDINLCDEDHNDMLSIMNRIIPDCPADLKELLISQRKNCNVQSMVADGVKILSKSA